MPTMHRQKGNKPEKFYEITKYRQKEKEANRKLIQKADMFIAAETGSTP